MGVEQHHAMVVTSWSEERIRAAHMEATSIGLAVSPVSEETINGFRSFAVFPDGSNEGWEESDEGDAQRAAFKAWLALQCHEDGSSAFKWLEVTYGEIDMKLVDGHDGSERYGKSE